MSEPAVLHWFAPRATTAGVGERAAILSARVLPALRREAQLVCWRHAADGISAERGERAWRKDDLLPAPESWPAPAFAVYHLEDAAPECVAIAALARRNPGLVVLHGRWLSRLCSASVREGELSREAYLEAVTDLAGARGAGMAERALASPSPTDPPRELTAWTLLLGNPLGLVVEDAEVHEAISGLERWPSLLLRPPAPAVASPADRLLAPRDARLRVLVFEEPRDEGGAAGVEPILSLLAAWPRRDHLEVSIVTARERVAGWKAELARRAVAAEVEAAPAADDEARIARLLDADLAIDLGSERARNGPSPWREPATAAGVPILLGHSGMHGPGVGAVLARLDAEGAVEDVGRFLAAALDEPSPLVELLRREQDRSAKDGTPAAWVESLLAFRRAVEERPETWRARLLIGRYAEAVPRARASAAPAFRRGALRAVAPLLSRRLTPEQRSHREPGPVTPRFHAEGDLVLATVATYADLPRALAMARSLRTVWPAGPRLEVAMVDPEVAPQPLFAPLDVRFVSIEELEIPNLPWLAAKLDAEDLRATALPFLLRRLVAGGAGGVLVLSTDLLFLASPAALAARRPDTWLRVVPKHRAMAKEFRLLGMATASAVGLDDGLFWLRAGEEAERLLAGWIAAVTAAGACRRRDEPGPLDGALASQAGVAVLHDPCHGVAAWNLHERPVRWSRLDGGPGDGFVLDGLPLVSVHAEGLVGAPRGENVNFDALADFCASRWHETFVAFQSRPYGWGSIGRHPLTPRLRRELAAVEALVPPSWERWPGDIGPVVEALFTDRGPTSVLPAYLDRVRAVRPDLQALDPCGELHPRWFLAWSLQYLGAEQPELAGVEHGRFLVVDRRVLASLADDVSPYFPGEAPAALADRLVADRGAVLARLRERGAPVALWVRVAAGEPMRVAIAGAQILRTLWEERVDLQAAFPAPLDEDLAALQAWMTRFGREEYEVPDWVAAEIAALDVERSLARLGAGLRTRPPQLARLRREGLTLDLLRGLTAESGADYAIDHRDLILLAWWLEQPHPGRAAALARLGSLVLVEEAGDAPPSQRAPTGTPVNVFGYFRSPIGFATASAGLVSALAAAGFEPRPTLLTCDTMTPDYRLADLAPTFAVDGRWNVVVSPIRAGYRLDEVFPSRWFRDRQTAGYLAWEQRDASPSWASGLAFFDRLWALSRFTAEATSRCTGRPCDVVPCVVDGEALRRTAAAFTRARFGLPEAAFVIGIVLDAASGLERKNPAAAVEAIGRAFSGRADVVVVLKVNHGQRPRFAPRAAALERRLADLGLATRVIREPRPADEVVGLLAQFDLYLSLHRAEGFGYTMAEAMALGVPVVATGYSGNLDFMTEDNSGLVRCREVVLEWAEGPFQPGTVWAEPDVAHAAELCDAVWRDRDAARARAERARLDIEAYASPAVVGERLKALLG